MSQAKELKESSELPFFKSHDHAIKKKNEWFRVLKSRHAGTALHSLCTFVYLFNPHTIKGKRKPCV